MEGLKGCQCSGEKKQVFPALRMLDHGNLGTLVTRLPPLLALGKRVSLVGGAVLYSLCPCWTRSVAQSSCGVSFKRIRIDPGT